MLRQNGAMRLASSPWAAVAVLPWHWILAVRCLLMPTPKMRLVIQVLGVICERWMLPHHESCQMITMSHCWSSPHQRNGFVFSVTPRFTGMLAFAPMPCVPASLHDMAKMRVGTGQLGSQCHADMQTTATWSNDGHHFQDNASGYLFDA